LKLTKTSWLIITIGLFVIVLAGLGAVRSQQVHQLDQLKDELALAQLKLKGFQFEKLTFRQKELEQQLSETASQSEAAKTTLSQPVKSITISDTLFDIAETNSVNVTEIKSSGLAESNLEGVPCSALSLNAQVEGEMDNLISFITMLNNDFAAGAVKSVDINIPDRTGEKKPTANFQMVIYTYQGG